MKQETSNYSGFIVQFEPKRSRKIGAWLNEKFKISDSYSSEDWGLGKKEIFLIWLPSTQDKDELKAICGAVLVERMHGNGGTGKPKYKFVHPIMFDNSVTQNYLNKLNISVENRISTSEKGERLELSFWLTLVDVIKTNNPLKIEEIDKLLQLVTQDTLLIGGTNRLNRLSEQRDAVGLVLDIAGINRQTIFGQTEYEKIETVDNFLALLSNHKLQERSLIEHDALWLKELLSTSDLNIESQTLRFGYDQLYPRVEIKVLDKNPLETLIGVDLLIYNTLFNSLIFIQYKSMELHKEDGWFYRPDHQLDNQIGCMNNAKNASLKHPHTKNRVKVSKDFRLNSEAFYFKFCEARKPDSAEASLIKGMTISLPHLEDFLKTPEAMPIKGLRVGYKNCNRYLNNTQFTDLAKSGWIGTSAHESEFLKEVVSASLNGNRSVVLALLDIPDSGTRTIRKTKC
jgi:hypothetical protein